MSKNKQLQRILKDSPQLLKNRIKSKTIEEVETDIENSKNQINDYRTALEQTKAPMVQEFPFFSLPSTRRELVNSALESLWTINKSTYNTIAEALSTINNNTDSLNNLIRILAVTEADLYTKLNKVSKVTKNESDKVEQLSRDIKNTAENANKLSDVQRKMVILRNESLDNLGNRLNLIDKEISKKANQSLLEGLIALVALQESKIEKKADVEVLSSYAKTNDIFTKEAVRKKLRNLWIAYGVTTAALIGGLIVSFLL